MYSYSSCKRVRESQYTGLQHCLATLQLNDEHRVILSLSEHSTSRTTFNTMSFNFQPAADSSDEETGIDLSAWKAGAVAKQAHAPVAPMGVAGHDDYVQAGSVIEDEEVLAFTAPVQRQGSLKRRWVPPEPVKSVSRVSDVRSRHSSSRTRSTEPEVEVRVVLPFRVNDGSSGEEDVEDFTAGGDVVRRILREVKSKGGRGRVVYRVEMDDWSLEEVGLFSVFPLNLFSLP